MGVSIGTGVSVAGSVTVGVKVLVKTGRRVLVGVVVTSETLAEPREQPKSKSPNRAIRPINNKVWFLIES
jgi:hypothetical protein